MSERDELGARALKLLDEESMVAVLRGLADGAQRPAELEERLPDAGHSVVMRRLRHLLEHELVTYEYLPGVPPRVDGGGIPHEAHYHLTDAARALLEIIAQADRWERTLVLAGRAARSSTARWRSSSPPTTTRAKSCCCWPTARCRSRTWTAARPSSRARRCAGGCASWSSPGCCNGEGRDGSDGTG